MLRYWMCDRDRLREVHGPHERPPAGGYLWIEAVDPTQDEVATLPGHLPVHQRARYDRYGSRHVLVLKPLWYRAGEVETGDLALVVDTALLITVRRGEEDPITPARHRVTERAWLRERGVWGAAYAIVDGVVDQYLKVSDEVAADVTALERRVMSGGRVDAIAGIYSLKREVLEFRDAVLPLEGIADDILGARHDPRRPAFRDVAHRIKRVGQAVRSSDELLDAILSAHLGQISMWQNADMRRISAWAAIITVPTLIAGIYGMNFARMPGLAWEYGFPAAIGLMVVVCGLLFRSFRRNDWL